MAEEKPQPPFKPLLYIVELDLEPASCHMQNIFHSKNHQPIPQFEEYGLELRLEELEFEKTGSMPKKEQIKKPSKDEVRSKLKQILGEKLTAETEADLLAHLDDLSTGEDAVSNDNHIQTDGAVEMLYEDASVPYQQNDERTSTPTTALDKIEAVKRQEIRKKIAHLARYRNSIVKPLCEAIIDGKPIRFQVISKRGNFVKVKIGRHQKKFYINEITDIKIIE
ncbi:hypothetical protein CU633_03120 [Bacillus sp. V3-13]|uniref:hypothetical protein n=1 Tax=Bacillus sp. V3-13 TaxID=2053728 RepID=UPI000C76E659|nr:hypothetical protein [Bacillus sp. V3-13]PLR78799.1 hypothetical protein CU633_03120 [Bacillus sp. V3-13]